MAKYQTNFQVDSIDGSEMIELRNPSGSGKNIRLLKIGIVSETSFAVYDLQRFDALATHSSAPDAPTQAEAFKWSPTQSNAVGEVWYGSSVSIVFNGTLDLHHDEQLDASDAGDDAEMIFSKYFDGEQIALVPGTSARFEIPPDAQANYWIKLTWEELPVLPAAHITSSVLPNSGAYTTATYFDIPSAWSYVTFLITYTAHASSTTARPQWRVSWSDGTNDFIAPIAAFDIDTSSTPVAARDQLYLTERYPSTITANTTIHIAVPMRKIPGVTKVRLDVAEYGDTVNPGTVVVTITGE